MAAGADGGIVAAPPLAHHGFDAVPHDPAVHHISSCTAGMKQPTGSRVSLSPPPRGSRS